MPFPESAPLYPCRQQVLAYLEAYADGFVAVVLATGLHPTINSFLPGAAKVTDSRGYALAHGRRTALQGLYICGFYNVATGILRTTRLQCPGPRRP